MAPRVAFELFGSKGVGDDECKALGLAETLRIDLVGFDELGGREAGVGCWFLALPSVYTGGSLYSACAEKPTFFLMRWEESELPVAWEETGE